MGSVPVGVNTRFTNCLHSVLDCARMFAECTSRHHSLMSSSHSFFCLPRIPVPDPSTMVTMPNTTRFVSLELFIRHTYPNNFNFLSITIWRTFRWHFILLRTSSFVIICCHLMAVFAILIGLLGYRLHGRSRGEIFLHNLQDQNEGQMTK